MPTRKPISPAERRYHDYLRRKTLKVGAVYETRLAKARRKELRRVLAKARDLGDPEDIAPLLEAELSEAGYLGEWWTGLWSEAGIPAARSTARTLRQAKAAGEDDIWAGTLRNYATQRAGQEITVVTGTWKRALVSLLRELMEEELYQGVEALTKKLYKGYLANLEKWQCRRIAQTESMIGMAEAGALAAQTLDVSFTKQWVISGLGNTRESHEAMDGIIVDQDEPFRLPGGLMMYPHDTSMGASAGEIINCACDVLRIPKGYDYNQPEPGAAPAATPEAPQTEEEIREARIKEFIEEMPADWSDELKKAKAENYLEIEKELGIEKGKPMSVEDADKQSANPNWSPNDKQYRINCATCTPAYALREFGFDVTAKGNVRGSGSINEKASREWYGMWKNADGTKAKPTTIYDWMSKKEYKAMTEKRYKEFFEEACKEKGTYAIGISWSGGGGHATILRRGADGKLVYIEPQHYIQAKGVQQDIGNICGLMKKSNIPWRDGVLRVDNKLFDTSWAGLFSAK